MLRALSVLAVGLVACADAARDGADRYPEGSATPRGLTEAERAVLAGAPLVAAESEGAPLGVVRAVAEYEPMAGILVAYEGPAAWLAILREMGRHITTTGDANLYVVCDTASEAATARSAFLASGADGSRVFTTVRRTDTIWIRDYGPRYIYENGIRAIVDHTYNRPRPYDNLFSSFWGPERGEAVYAIPLVHGGGNYHLDAAGGGAATRLVVNENPGLTGSQVVDLWREFQGVETGLFQALPAFVDATQHIDMWMQIVADDAIVISDWPLEPGSSWDATCDAAAAAFAAAGWTVTRTPAVRQGGTHYTFTNMVMCNDLVLVPEYDNVPAQYSQQALAAWQAAVPDSTVVQVDCDGIVTASGVMHCIVMHVPASSGGADPVAWLAGPNAGSFVAGETVNLEWRTDDDEAVVEVDLLFSAGRGQAFEVIAAGIADTGSFAWTVPDAPTETGTLRVVARDAGGRTGADDSDGPIAITGARCSEADFAAPLGTLTFADVSSFLAAFSAGDQAADLAAPGGQLTFADVSAFLTAFVAGCP